MVAYRKTATVEAKLLATRQRLIRAARHEIARVGLRGLNVTEVADAAGVSVGTLYRHFPAKHELLREIVDDICGFERDAVAKVAADGDEPVERVLAAVACFAERAVASGRVAYAVIAEPAPPEIESVRLEHRRALADTFAAVIGEAVDAGALPPQSPAVTATAIVGAISEVLVGPLSPATRADVDIDEVVGETLAFVLRSVGAQPVLDLEGVPA